MKVETFAKKMMRHMLKGFQKKIVEEGWTEVGLSPGYWGVEGDGTMHKLGPIGEPDLAAIKAAHIDHPFQQWCLAVVEETKDEKGILVWLISPHSKFAGHCLVGNLLCAISGGRERSIQVRLGDPKDVDFTDFAGRESWDIVKLLYACLQMWRNEHLNRERWEF